MKCPGQDTRYWKPGDIFESPCPGCGGPLEFFKDEATRRCRKCGRVAPNPKMDFGCAAYCKYAQQCLGELTPELLQKRKELLKDRVALEMKRAFGQDFRSISHAVKTARYAEEIGREEKADLPVLLAAAYLHHLDEDKVRQILEDLGTEKGLTAGVLNLTKESQAQKEELTFNGKILSDAHFLALLEEQQREDASEAEREQSLESLYTDHGRSIAGRTLHSGKE
jgi:hypothetical protein